VQLAKARLGAAAGQVQWIVSDLLTWQPVRRYDVWHDRALLHFMTTDASVQRYLDMLDAATEPGAVAILATFAADGPDHCSGLPVRRYAAEDLGRLLGDDWLLITSRREEHVTPGGSVQPFTWTVFRRS
jgi:trans-aconitate methyltransferase